MHICSITCILPGFPPIIAKKLVPVMGRYVQYVLFLRQTKKNQKNLEKNTNLHIQLTNIHKELDHTSKRNDRIRF